MADMGFLPQVEWLLRRMPEARQTLPLLRNLGLGSRPGRAPPPARPVLHEVQAKQVTVDEMEHRFLKVHQLDKAKAVRGNRRWRRPRPCAFAARNEVQTDSSPTCGARG